MGFSTYDSMINAITVNSQKDRYGFYKIGATSQIGIWQSMWNTVGSPGAGGTPSASLGGTTYGPASSAGGMNFGSVSPSTRYLMTFGGVATQSLSLRLYDRLVAISNVSTASTGNKTVNLSTPSTRYTNGVSVECWLEYTTASTTTAAVISMNSYTNEQGITGRAGGSVTMPAAAMGIMSMVQLPMQVGDAGIQAISTINVGTANTSGVVNVVLLYPLCDIPININDYNERDFVMQLTGLDRIYDAHCLSLMYMPTATTAPTIYGVVRSAYN